MSSDERWDTAERKAALDKLLRSEAFLSLFLDSITDFVTVHDTQYNVLKINKATEHFFGKDAVGRKCYEVYQARDGVCPDCPTAKVLATGQPAFSAEQVGTRGDIVEIAAFPIKDEQGNIIAVIEHGRDITQRKRAEDALRQHALEQSALAAIDHAIAQEEPLEKVFHVALTRLMDAIEVDAAGVYLLRDDTLELLDYAGLSPEFAAEVRHLKVGEGLAGRVALEKRPLVFDISQYPLGRLAELIAREGFKELAGAPMLLGKRLTGVMVTGRRRPAPFTEQQLHFLTTLAYQLDLCYQRRQALEETERSRNFLTTVLNSTGDAISVIDVRDYTIAAVNRAFLEQYQLTEEQAIGRTCYEVTHGRSSPCTPPDDICPITATLVDGTHVRVEHVHYRQDGSETYVEVSSSPIRDAGGNIVQVVHSARDITRRKLLEESLKDSLERLQKAMEGTINAVALTSEMRDPYTAGHQRRVSKLACAIAEEMGLPQEQVEAVRVAGQIHDIGKIGVPAEILSKPGSLTELEFSIVKTHAQVGCDILKTIDFPWPIAQIVRQHHERWDGSGYPLELKGDDILMEARILAVADVVEVMAFHRPFRPAPGIDKALEDISRNSGVLYDTRVVDACLKVFAEKNFSFA